MREAQMFLLVEDNPDDSLLLRQAFNRGNLLNPMHVVTSGEAALEYLQGSGRYANREEFPLPSVVLLDLRLPGMSGLEVLRWIRSQSTLQTLRVIVLTSSESLQDVNQAYKLGANSFLVKPMDLDHLCRMTEALQGYWVWLDSAPEVSRPAPLKQKYHQPSVS
jgi:CheY-like chemotaxis protein